MAGTSEIEIYESNNLRLAEWFRQHKYLVNQTIIVRLCPNTTITDISHIVICHWNNESDIQGLYNRIVYRIINDSAPNGIRTRRIS